MKRRSLFKQLCGGITAAFGVKALPAAAPKPATNVSEHAYFRAFPPYKFDATRILDSNTLVFMNGTGKVLLMKNGELSELA
jgi:hypothetical protein